MKLSLNKIMKFNPCGQHDEGNSGISRLAKHLNKVDFNDTKEFELIEVLKSNGIKDAIWCLRCFDYLEYCLFLVAVVKDELLIYEATNDSKSSRKAIQAIRDYKADKITKDELNAFSFDAYAAAAYAAAGDAYLTAYTVASNRKEKWIEIEKLFIKHFG